jgi:hypothetical protein
LCDATREVAAIVTELQQRYPDGTITHRVSLPITAAVVAVRRGEWARTLEILEPVKPYDHAAWSEFWPAFLRGQAHLASKHPAEAAAEFQTILDRRGEGPIAQLYPLAQLGLARALTLEGDREKARDAYETLLAIWPDADPTLAPVREARAERARLH